VSIDDQLLANGRTIGEVLAEDAEQRRRDEAAAAAARAAQELAQTDATIDRFFNVQPLRHEDDHKPEPTSDADPDLHAGARPGKRPEDAQEEAVFAALFGR
jgi:hypothetical protein